MKLQPTIFSLRIASFLVVAYLTVVVLSSCTKMQAYDVAGISAGIIDASQAVDTLQETANLPEELNAELDLLQQQIQSYITFRETISRSDVSAIYTRALAAYAQTRSYITLRLQTLTPNQVIQYTQLDSQLVALDWKVQEYLNEPANQFALETVSEILDLLQTTLTLYNFCDENF